MYTALKIYIEPRMASTIWNGQPLSALGPERTGPSCVAVSAA